MSALLYHLRQIIALCLLGPFLCVGISSTSTSAPPAPAAAAGATYYVRPDGGDAAQCTGRADVPYPGSGTGLACAWDHPFRALPPGGTPLIHGGDTLLIAAGSYRMGYGAPGAAACDVEAAWDCHMPPIPSGTDAAHPTRILGAGPASTRLWGAERANWIIDLHGSSYVEIGGLEISDHSGCVEFHTGGLACQRDAPPYGDWAALGISAADSSGVYLHDLNIHGLAGGGVNAGRLADWTVEDVRIAANGWSGWDGDIEGDDANSGLLLFRRWVVEWNGCAETYPGGQPTGCWAQTAGGYGDGVGTGETGGHWVIEDSRFLHNTSDGLDLLYTRVPGSLIELRRVWAEGNAGNQLKTNGPVSIENSIVVGNCGFFAGQPFTYNVDACRAAGNAISLDLRPGDQASVTYTTIAGQGDCLVLAGCAVEGACSGSEKVFLADDIFQGAPEFGTPDDTTCLAYQETFPADPFDMQFSIIHGVKDDACPGANNLCNTAPGVLGSAVDGFDAHLLPGSPAVDAAGGACPALDFDNRPRPLDGDGTGGAACDIGAYEFNRSLGRFFLPLARR